MNLFSRAALVAVFLLLTDAAFFAQTRASSVAATAKGGSIWKDADEKTITKTLATTGVASPRRDIVPQFYRTLQLNKAALLDLLASAPPEASGPIQMTGTELQIPLPYGGFGRFLIQDSPIMESKLAAKFPELKTYVGQGIDDPTATMRIDVTPRGFHAIILSATGEVYIDPYSRDTDTNYISYFKSDFIADKPFSCFVESKGKGNEPLSRGTTPYRPSGATLKSYRLALACTGEYATAVCSPNAPTVAGTLAAMITSVNRCTAVYEREFAIRFLLINNADKLVYLNGTTDPYTNGNGSTMLNQNQSNIDSVIGTANYDFGHVFSTGGGGVAQLGVICRAGQKAKGVTGTSNPVGDPYDIDYVVHEMGHQFGGNHPFNGTTGSCSGGNRNASTAYEPGSGITIMAYAGICSPQDLAPHSDDYFYTINYDEIDTYTSTGLGAGCAQTTATGNTPPTISALTAFTIPSQTPFSLTASASDVDGDTLTYCWEEFDKGAAQDPTANPRDNGASPIFRSFPPTTNPTRIFPSLTYILNNQNVPPATISTDLISAEFLPTTSRTMTYRVTVRDNRAAGGGSNYASTTVISTNTAGPFVITAPNVATTMAGGSSQTVTWNVANTSAAIVNCANVKISLSTDGGYTFPIVLASSVPNNGSATVTIPNTANVATTQGRIKVEAVGNIFFDISDANLTITSTNTAPTLNVTGNITVVRGTPTATVATVGNASDVEDNPVTVSVSNLPFGATITPSITSGSISLTATVTCSLVTTLTTRTYPFTLTVTDSNGSTTSGTVNLIVAPNPSPTLGAYPNITVGQNSSATSTPASAAADANNNLLASPYSVLPTTLPGGGTVSVNQANGVVTATTTAGSTLGTTSVRVTALDSCGASAVSLFNIIVSSAVSPSISNGPPPSPVIVGTPYTFTFTGTGSPAPTFSVTGGTLPPGLTLSSAGVLSGTATSAVTGNFPNITVTASNGNLPNAQQMFSLSAVTRAANYLTGFGLSGGNAAYNFDYDLDGISNLLEYALNLDPTVANLAGLPVATIKNYSGTNYLSMTFTRSSVATDLTYTVQGSSDLINWSDLASSVGGAPTAGAGFVGETDAAPLISVEVRDTVPSDGTPGLKRFLRLKVTAP
jgi:hypothetical protein